MTLLFQKIKADLFNNIFASECSPAVNPSTVPNFSYKTQRQISGFEIKEDDILLTIKSLNLDKTLGWNNVSICMVQLCGKPIVKLLKYLFEPSSTAGISSIGK